MAVQFGKKCKDAINFWELLQISLKINDFFANSNNDPSLSTPY